MDTMNDLLICTKAVGYSVVENAAGGWSVTRNEGSGCWEYNPRTNDAQAMELLKWLLQRGWVIFKPTPPAYKTEFEYALAHQDHGEIQTYTLNEAIIKAVVAMEDTHE